MNKFKKDDELVIIVPDENNFGRAGMVIDVMDGGYYTLDCLPNNAYDENCLDYAKGADLIREERRRQIDQEGYDAQHDFRHSLNEIVAGAVSYAMCDIDMKEAEAWWPWSFESWKPKDQKRNLVRAGALIAAAIDKMQEEKDFEKWKGTDNEQA